MKGGFAAPYKAIRSFIASGIPPVRKAVATHKGKAKVKPNEAKTTREQNEVKAKTTRGQIKAMTKLLDLYAFKKPLRPQ
jgi:hypothetical protein